jgi:hypothetical protein
MPHGVGQFLRLERKALRQPELFDHRLVDPGQLCQRGGSLVEQIDRRKLLVVAAFQRMVDLGAERGKLLGVSEPGALLVERFLLAHLRIDGANLLKLVAEQVHAAFEGGLILDQRGDFAADSVQGIDHFPELLALALQFGVAIQQVDVFTWLEQ